MSAVLLCSWYAGIFIAVVFVGALVVLTVPVLLIATVDILPLPSPLVPVGASVAYPCCLGSGVPGGTEAVQLIDAVLKFGMSTW